jgi:hypothetical protein
MITIIENNFKCQNNVPLIASSSLLPEIFGKWDVSLDISSSY